MQTGRDAIAKNKLKLLYLLNSAEIRLLETQLIRIVDELDMMDYFDLQTNLHELVEGELLARRDAVNGTFYAITEMGKSTLEYFRKEISYALRKRIDAYLDENRDALSLESQLFGEYMQIAEHQYRVTLQLVENDVPVFEVGFLAETKEQADRYVRGWRKNATRLYRRLFETLLDGV